MALLSDLVRIVAEIEGLEEVSVGIFARAAREAGYISQGGRGRSAAKMSFRDAANLLIAVNGCSLAKDVPAMVGLIRQLPADETNEENAVGLSRKGATFGDDLEFLLNLFSMKGAGKDLLKNPGPTTVVFHRPSIKAEIETFPLIEKGHVVQLAVYRSDFLENLAPDREDQTLISQRTLLRVAEAIAN